MEKLRQGAEFIFSSYKRTAAILFIAAISLAIPVTITFLGQNQDLRQQASQVCENVAADIMLAIDKSGSMDQGSGSDKLIAKAREAATSFVDVIATDTNNTIGLVSYSSRSRTSLDSQLTSNFPSVKEAINGIDASGATCIECAIKIANDEISTRGRDNIKNAVVLLTDGKANAILSTSNNVGFNIASDAALNRVREGFEKNGTVYFTIGLGNDVQTDFLQEIANLSGGKYFFAPTANELQSIYTQISQIIGKSSISGFVYDDANGNGTLDNGEIKLEGWTINLIDKDSSGSTPTTIASDASGGFSFSGLCTGEYTVSASDQSGWTITSPQNNLYEIILTNGDSSTEKSFGVQSGTISPPPTETPAPTPTCTPRPADTANATEPDGGWCPAPDMTTLDLSITLTGIGSASNSALGLNNDPERPDRIVEIKILDSNSTEVKAETGSLTYNNTLGIYEGSINLGTDIQTGSYLVKARLDNTLWKTIPGIQTITAGTSNRAPTTQLITGDINQDNEINLLDYNMFLTCLQTNECGENNNTAGFLNRVFSFFRNLIVKDVSAQIGTNNCRIKPIYCDNSWASRLSSCQTPSGGWCAPISPTPTPSTCTVKPSYCNYSWASLLSYCQAPNGGWCATPTPSPSLSPSLTPTPTAIAGTCGTIAGIACPTGFVCTGIDPDIADDSGTCVTTPTCGDNVCQNITCSAIGCPAPETAQSCPADCATTSSVTVISPNGGEIFTVGQAINIRWKTKGIPYNPDTQIDIMDDRIPDFVISNFGTAPALDYARLVSSSNDEFVYEYNLLIPSGFNESLPAQYQNTFGGNHYKINAIVLLSGIAGTNSQSIKSDSSNSNFTISTSPTSTPAPTANPEVNTSEKAIFDFNDDGIVDELDLNILYAGFARRIGD